MGLISKLIEIQRKYEEDTRIRDEKLRVLDEKARERKQQEKERLEKEQREMPHPNAHPYVPKAKHYKFAYDDPDYNRMEKAYYESLEKIQSRYSVLYNMGLIDGPEIQEFLSDCDENISLFYIYRDLCNKYNISTPANVPAFKCKAILYEKQENYADAINTCAEAIFEGLPEDGTKGKMYGRLARVIRKFDGEVPKEILDMLD